MPRGSVLYTLEVHRHGERYKAAAVCPTKLSLLARVTNRANVRACTHAYAHDRADIHTHEHVRTRL